MIPRLFRVSLLLALCALAVRARQPERAAHISLRTSALKINVEDMDRALSFYGEKLGFEVADRSRYPREVVLKTGDKFRLILNKVARLRKAGPAETQVGLTLQVNDLEQAMARMKSLGVEFGEAGPRREAVGNAIFILDPSGMRISLMHETAVRNEPFKEPRVYNFGVLIPDMAAGRDFYSDKLGFVVRSEKYLPLDLPLGHADKTFAFMLHYRPGVTPVRSEYPDAAPFVTMVFETDDLPRAVAELKRDGVKILAAKSRKGWKGVAVEDPFGNVSEVVESSGRPGELAKLKQLYDQKRYFELRDAVESYRGDEGARMLFFRGAVANLLNRPRTSTKYLKQYVARAGADDEWLSEAYTLLADDFVKLYEYGQAADAYRTTLERFKQTLKPGEVEDYENAAALYGALRSVPRQSVSAGESARLNGPSPGAGWKAPVEANGRRIELGLDTGANVSLLAKSVAEKLGVKMLGQSIALGSITSIRVQPGLGFLPLMKLGGATVRNAVFMVLDDKALTFPDGFFLKGVVGFPVIEGLRSVSFDGDGTVSVARKSSGGGRPNMCLDGKDILFRGVYENRELTFLLDTGAERSVLYVPFLHDFEGEVKDRFSLRTERFTGVGGTEEVPAYVVKDFAVKFSGREARLPEIRLLTRALNDNGKFFYGNVGGDLLKRFRRVTLDFVSMRVTFS